MDPQPVLPVQTEKDTIRKRRGPTSQSLANLQHKKQCPLCGKMFGNAKRGRCGGLDGQCDHVFVLGKRAKNAAKHPPPVEVVPKGDVTHGNRVAEAFEELKKQAMELAAESGWSVVLIASGATDVPLESGSNTYSVEHQVVTDDETWSTTVGVLSHGVCGAAVNVAANQEVLKLAAKLTCESIEKQNRQGKATSVEQTAAESMTSC